MSANLKSPFCMTLTTGSPHFAIYHLKKTTHTVNKNSFSIIAFPAVSHSHFLIEFMNIWKTIVNQSSVHSTIQFFFIKFIKTETLAHISYIH